MSPQVGTLVFSRYESRRLPGKALRAVGGSSLLERVIRRAQLCSVPVYLATTVRPADDPLVAVAGSLGVRSFRGSADQVLERAVLAAESFGLDAFVRMCGDRPLFPLDHLRDAIALAHECSSIADLPDLITTDVPGIAVRGLTTEVIRTQTLRKLMEQGPSAEEQEHVTPAFYEHPEDFRIVELPVPPADYACPGFAVDTESDLDNLNKIFEVCDALDLSPSDADRIYRA